MSDLLVFSHAMHYGLNFRIVREKTLSRQIVYVKFIDRRGIHDVTIPWMFTRLEAFRTGLWFIRQAVTR